ncbi:MAG: hypothetical protein OK441_07200, partial [Thaumarchaeota archaeon]|nr:hypothetical protein [Nitrososphaerota archaeon]
VEGPDNPGDAESRREIDLQNPCASVGAADERRDEAVGKLEVIYIGSIALDELSILQSFERLTDQSLLFLQGYLPL